MIDEPVAVGVLADQDEVAQVVARYNLLAVPVVDDERPAGRASSRSTTRWTPSCRPPGGSGCRASSSGAERGPWSGSRGTGLPRRRRHAAPDRAARRLWDRIEQREFLRLRGRFRGRRGLVAFLAVMGPGLIAGIAGNDAGGITTYSVLGAETGLCAAVAVPDHDRHPRDRPGDGGAARRRHRPGPVRPDPRPVRRPLDGVRDGRSCSSPTSPTPSPSSPGAAAALEIFGIPRLVTVPIVAVGDLGARPVRELPDGRAGVPLGDGRVPRLHRLGRPGEAGLGRGRRARSSRPRSRAARGRCC